MAQDSTLHKTGENEHLKGDFPLGLFTKTYCKQTGCRRLYVSFVFRADEPEKIDFIKIYGDPRSNDCGCSYLEGFSDLLTLSLRRMNTSIKSEARLLVKALRDHRCNKPMGATRPSERTNSCADAIGRAIQDALGVSEAELRGRPE